jgi:hypothetical protein
MSWDSAERRAIMRGREVSIKVRIRFALLVTATVMMLAGPVTASTPPQDDVPVVDAIVLWATVRGTPVTKPACYEQVGSPVTCYGQLESGGVIVAVAVEGSLLFAHQVTLMPTTAGQVPTATPTTMPPPSGGHELEGTFTLPDRAGIVGTWTICRGGGGFDDFGPDMNVTVRDGAGVIIGSGSTRNLSEDDLTSGREELRSAAAFASTRGRDFCAVTFSIPVGDAGFYSVGVGSRGERTYSREELEATNWWVQMSLGS